DRLPLPGRRRGPVRLGRRARLCRYLQHASQRDRRLRGRDGARPAPPMTRPTRIVTRRSSALLIPLWALVLALGAPPSLHAQQADSAATDLDASLAQSRELIKGGDYDHAIELLRGAIGQAGHRTERLREAYLLMIKTDVMAGNFRRLQPQGREASALY